MDDLLSRLLGLEQVRTTDGEVHLDWLNPVAAWVLFFVALAVAGGSVFVYLKERRDVGTGPKIFLSVLRALVILFLLTLLMGPILTVDIHKFRRAVVLVLVDESLSMKKVDPKPRTEANKAVWRELADVCGVSEQDLKGLSRMDLVRRALTNPKTRILEQISEKVRVECYTFSRRARPVRREDLAELEAAGTETAIGDAIREALAAHRGEQVAAVLVFTDGRNNTGRDPEEVSRDLNKRHIPILAVMPGYPQEPRDIAVGELDAPDTVPVDDLMTVKFTLSHDGYKGRKQAVLLYLHPIADESVTLPRDPEAIEKLLQEGSTRLIDTWRGVLEEKVMPNLGITWRPREKGVYAIILKAEPKEDEITRKNNYALGKLRVSDNVVKVLLVDYLPRWEYRYLKNALIRHPNILAHCLLTSADPDFVQAHSLAASHPKEHLQEYPEFFRPLREFPGRKKDLVRYDVIMLGDVPPGHLGGNETLRNIVSFVDVFRGGVVFISGTRYNPEAYVGTPLEKLLPVDPLERQPHGTVFDRRLHYLPTYEGIGHPITSFVSDKDRNREIWTDPVRGLPPLFWFKRVRSVRPGAHPLVFIEAGKNGGSDHPLFVYAQYGGGRSVISLTDETWRWRFNRGDDPWFFPFWRQCLEWLREPRLHSARRYAVTVERERYSIGEDIVLRARAFDSNFEPLEDPVLGAQIVPPVGRPVKIEMKPDPDADRGHYVYTYRASHVGAHEVKVGDPADPDQMGMARFEVIIPNREEENPIIDKALLLKLVQGRGRLFALHEVRDLPKEVKTTSRRFTERRQDSIWDSPLAYLVFALLITTEWILRKMFRLL